MKKSKLYAWGRSLLLDAKLRGKLLVIFFLLLVLPLGVFTLYAFHRINGVIEEQTFSAAEKAFEDTHIAVEDLFDRLPQVADILTMDSSLYALAASDPADTSYIQRLQDRDRISTTFSYLRSLSGVDRIRMYVSTDYLYTNSADIVSLSSAAGSQWLAAFQDGASAHWFAPSDFSDQPAGEQNWYALMRVIYDPSHVQEPLAILRIDIAADRIDAAVNRSTITQNGIVFLLDGNRVLTGSSDQAQDLADILAPENGDQPAGSWNDLSAGRRKYHTRYIQLEDCGWALAVVLPHDDIFRTSRELQLELLAVVVLLAGAAYLLAYLLSQSMVRRLLRLNDTMQAVQHGDVSARVEPLGQDEIGQLARSFSNMMTRIDTLMDEKLEQGQQIKALELKALQAQINPHFLYNSLDLINCTAIAHHVPQISRMVNALAQFYRLSLSRGREVIPLADELRHVRLYVEIQNMRFENRVQVVWDVEPGTERYLVIKIVLQPIIENAIIHGIFEKPDKTGTVRVSVRRCEEGLRILVEDDGVGMDAETLAANFAADASSANTKGGYGVRNINERLHLAYGPPYGLYCESTPGAGTRVAVLIPAVEPPEETDE